MYTLLCVCLCPSIRLSACVFLCFPLQRNCLCLTNYLRLCLSLPVSPSHTPFPFSPAPFNFVVNQAFFLPIYPHAVLLFYSPHSPSITFSLIFSVPMPSLSLCSLYPSPYTPESSPPTPILSSSYPFVLLRSIPSLLPAHPSPLSALPPAFTLTSLPSSILWPILHYLPY